MDKHNLIKQPYHLTVAKYSYGIYEERILLRIIESLQDNFLYDASIDDWHRSDKSISNDYLIQLKVNQLFKKRTQKYKQVEKALDCLLCKTIKIKGNDKKYGPYKFASSLILEYEYFSQKEFVRLKISRKLLGYLCASLSSYTRYSMNLAFNCSSAYTIRIYKYLSHWRDRKNMIIDLRCDKLRDILELGGKYERANSLKQIILAPAQKELKQKADIWFEIKEPIKEGRKVVGWKIVIRKKETKPTPKKLPPPTKNPLKITKTPLTAAQKNEIDAKIREKNKQQLEWENHLQANLQSGGINNLIKNFNNPKK